MPAEWKISIGPIAVDGYPPSRRTTVTSSIAGSPIGGASADVAWADCPARRADSMLLTLLIVILIGLDCLPQTDVRADRIQNQCDASDARDDKWANDGSAADRFRPPNDVVDVVYSDVRRPVRGHALLLIRATQLEHRAHVLSGELQAREAAPVGRLLARRPAEQLAANSHRVLRVRRRQIHPAKSSGDRRIDFNRARQHALSIAHKVKGPSSAAGRDDRRRGSIRTPQSSAR